LDHWLDRLEQARSLDPADRAAVCLETLAEAPGPAVARALKGLRRLGHDGYAETALAAFPRLCHDGLRIDPGCAGRRAIAEGLLALDWTQSEPWWEGLGIVQWEPVYGGRVDAGAGLRGLCALGLVRSGDTRAPLALARLLADPEVEARRGAVRALREAPSLWALPLLAHRALLRAEDLDAQLDILHGLLEREDEAAFHLVADLLADADGESREAAAIALGERGGDAGARLLWCRLAEEVLPPRRRPLWLGLALSRCDEGRPRLLRHLATAPAMQVREAAWALDGLRDEELTTVLAGPEERRP
jgi:HEAT repeat protein